MIGCVEAQDHATCVADLATEPRMHNGEHAGAPQATALLAALIHLSFFLLESVWFERPGVWRRFGLASAVVQVGPPRVALIATAPL